MKLKKLHNQSQFPIILFAIGVAGFFLGNLSYRTIKTVFLHLTKTPSKSSTFTILENNHSKLKYLEGNDSKIFELQFPLLNLLDPFNITVIKTSSSQEDLDSGIWNSLDYGDNHPRSLNFKNMSNTLWVVTPTYRRGDQLAMLNRVGHALYPVRSFVKWLVIDEYETGSEQNMKHIDKFLKTMSIPYVLKRSTPRDSKEKVIFRPKGVDARNEALKFFREDPSVESDDVAYFADDDNTYDSEIFHQMRSTWGISMWPTGVLTQKTGISTPIVRNGHVDGFFDGWVVNRRVPVDFAMFAVNVGVIRENSNVKFPYIAGYIETMFLQKLVFSKDESSETLMENFAVVQPMASNGTDILTWHTKNSKNKRNFKQSSTFPNHIMRYQEYKNLDTLYTTYMVPLQNKQ